MVDPLLLINALVPVILLVAAGWVARQQKWVDSPGERTLLKLTINLLYPALIFKYILGNTALREPSILGQALLTGVLTIGGGILLSLWLAPLFGIRERVQRRTFGVSCGVFNFGYLAIPVAESLYGEETTGVMLAVNAAIELPIWGLGFVLLSGGFTRDSWKRILSPPLIALLIALPINYFGWQTAVPFFLDRFFAYLGACAIPIGVMMAGMTMYDLVANSDRSLWRDRRPMIGGITLRLLAIPAIMLAAAVWLPLSQEVRQVLVIHSAMPAGMFPIVLARHYQGHPTTAMQVTVSTSLAMVVTLPLWLMLGTSLIRP